MRRTEPRVAPVPVADRSDEVTALLAPVGGDAADNVFATMANHPKLMKRWMVFANHVLAKSTLPARERELAILRIGWRSDAGYEFAQHAVIEAIHHLTLTGDHRIVIRLLPLANRLVGLLPVSPLAVRVARPPPVSRGGRAE